MVAVPPRGRARPRPGGRARPRPPAEPRPRPLRLPRRRGRPLGGRRLRRTCRPRASRAGASCRSSSAPPRSSPASWPWRRGSRARRAPGPPTTRSCPPACACASSRSTASSAAWPSTWSPAARCRPSAPSWPRGPAARLAAEPERVPAIVWTTIATGRGPEAHGIQAADARRIAGLRTPVSLDAERSPFASALGAATDLLRLTRPQPPSAVLRSVKTFWNVASEKGLRVGVVNWWATWPADAVNGWIVTDRAAFKLEKGGPPDREVYPAEAFDRPAPAARRVRAGPRPPPRPLPPRRRPRAARGRAAGPRGALPARARHLHHAAAGRGAGERPRRPRLQARRGARPVPLRGRPHRRGGGAGSARATCWCSSATPAGSRAAARVAAEGLLVLSGGPGGAGRPRQRSRSATWPRPSCTCSACRRAASSTGSVLEARALRRRSAATTRCASSTPTAAARPSARPQSDFDQDVLEQLKSLGYIQ